MKYSFETGGFYNPIVSDEIPTDAVDLSRADYLSLLDGLSTGLVIVRNAQGKPELQEAPGASLQKLIARYTNAVQAHLDSTASDWGFSSISDAVTYAEEPAVPKFQEEGRAFRAWRSACWAYFYAQSDALTAGEREFPPIDQFLTELPELEFSRV